MNTDLYEEFAWNVCVTNQQLEEGEQIIFDWWVGLIIRQHTHSIQSSICVIAKIDYETLPGEFILHYMFLFSAHVARFQREITGPNEPV